MEEKEIHWWRRSCSSLRFTCYTGRKEGSELVLKPPGLREVRETRKEGEKYVE